MNVFDIHTDRIYSESNRAMPSYIAYMHKTHAWKQTGSYQELLPRHPRVPRSHRLLERSCRQRFQRPSHFCHLDHARRCRAYELRHLQEVAIDGRPAFAPAPVCCLVRVERGFPLVSHYYNVARRIESLCKLHGWKSLVSCLFLRPHSKRCEGK